MKYFLIAGEPSGDMHAANLMKEIRNRDKAAEFHFFGGDLMDAQGGKLLKHYREMAYMGILPVLLNLRKIKQNLDDCKKYLLDYKPDVLVLIDYPGFNLRMAEFAKKNGITTSYYISPKIWAWKTRRVKKVKAYVDHMYTILPFETAFYKKYNYPVKYVGNPLWDKIQKELANPASFQDFCALHQLKHKPIIALLAGSRKHEVEALLPVMQNLSTFYPDHQFVIAGAPGLNAEFYSKFNNKNLPLIEDDTYALLRNSEAAIVASGTATLETALLSTPQVVIYKMGLGWLLEMFRKQILKTEFFSLVNLIAEKEVVKELFQSQVTVKNIKTELDKLIEKNDYWIQQLKGYSLIQQKLNTEGASKKTAHYIVNSITKHD